MTGTETVPEPAAGTAALHGGGRTSYVVPTMGLVVEDEFRGVEEGPEDVFGGGLAGGFFGGVGGGGFFEFVVGGFAAEGEEVEFGDDFGGGEFTVGELFDAAFLAAEFVLEGAGIHHVEGLNDAGFEVAFAGGVGAGIGAAEGVHEVRTDFVAPGLDGAGAGRTAIEIVLGGGNVVDGVEEDFGGETAAVGAREIFGVGEVVLVRCRAELVKA